jgi:hypothetical protein
MVVVVRQPRLARPITHQAAGARIASRLAAVILGLVIVLLALASIIAAVEFVRTDVAIIVNGALSAMTRAQTGAAL